MDFTLSALAISRLRRQAGPGVHRFIVRDQFGRECEVGVEFAPAALQLIERSSRRRLASDSSHWLACAERARAAYLWTQDAFPPDARLVLQEVSPNELELARRWQREPMNATDADAWPETKPQTLGKRFYLQSIIAILLLYVLATFAPHTLASGLSYLRPALSSSILYAALFLSGTLCGPAFADMTAISAARKLRARGAANVYDRNAPPTFDQSGLTPVEHVIRGY